MTLLHEASKNGRVAVVQYLLETAKADVEAKNVSELGGFRGDIAPGPPSSSLSLRGGGVV